LRFNRILILFDNSKLSFKALYQAIDLKLAKPAEILTLHVITDIPLTIQYSKIESKDNKVVISPWVNQVYEEIKVEMRPVLKNIIQVYNKSIFTLPQKLEYLMLQKQLPLYQTK
jgi:nucleotide-binding universal stress UspA family protein